MASPHTPQRIVCLQPSATVILAAIGELATPSNAQVYCADSSGIHPLVCEDYRNAPAPTLLQGLDATVFVIHPELFQGSNAVSTKGIRQITAVPRSQLKNSLV